MSDRRASLRALLVSALCALACVLGTPHPVGAAESGDRVLPGCGICYPGGYDPNTVGDVEGRVSDIAVPDEGPVRFTVSDDEELWVVLVAPAWFWKEANPQIGPGDRVVVHGSKSLGADGKLYIVAQTVRILGGASAPVLLRDSRGIPLWRGHRGGGQMRGGGPGRR